MFVFFFSCCPFLPDLELGMMGGAVVGCFGTKIWFMGFYCFFFFQGSCGLERPCRRVYIYLGIWNMADLSKGDQNMKTC
jgi:heme/copper-type cytochrome/quinol oxidase subunit 1